ncbi:MAG: crossover junction endodeoxyribonuclease RuvC [bacterium]
MNILGIDPGFGRLGYGAVRVIRDTPELILCGCLETPKEMAHGDRLVAVRREVLRLLDEIRPAAVGVETLFFSKNIKTAIKVAEARGVILETLAERGVRIIECSPQEVKLAVTGYGNAEKQQVQEMVRIFLKLKSVPKPDDAADALALAIAASRM